mmetsp:Transcript_105078/g.296937  ORF Transcript_105078/g.296937 Transcript_105078/m.296937 type:complete len:203 (+) Transcript_105078:27-635(+)
MPLLAHRCGAAAARWIPHGCSSADGSFGGSSGTRVAPLACTEGPGVRRRLTWSQQPLAGAGDQVLALARLPVAIPGAVARAQRLGSRCACFACRAWLCGILHAVCPARCCTGPTDSGLAWSSLLRSGHAGLRPCREAAALVLAVRLGAVREGLLAGCGWQTRGDDGQLDRRICFPGRCRPRRGAPLPGPGAAELGWPGDAAG